MGFGEVPPTVPSEGGEDAQDFFGTLVEERQQVKKQFCELHAKAARGLQKKILERTHSWLAIGYELGIGLNGTRPITVS